MLRGVVMITLALSHVTTLQANVSSTVAAGGRVRWFVDGRVLSPAVQALITGNLSSVYDGVLPCCRWLSVDDTGELVIESAALVNRTPGGPFATLLRSNVGVVVDIGGDAKCCPSVGECPLWNRRMELAQNLTQIAIANNLTGFTLDWEFAQSFNWSGFNATMEFVGEALSSHNIGLEICINTLVEVKAWAKGGDPTGNTYYRWMPWATMMTNMGTYVLCDDSCTDAERWANVTKLSSTVNKLVKIGGYSARQISPGLFLSECTQLPGSNETSTHGWTQSTMRAFLEDVYGQGVRSVDVWCGVGEGLALPCPTCSWVFDELERWKGWSNADTLTL